MTEKMRERVMASIEKSNGALTVEFCKEAIEQRKRSLEFLNSRPSWEQGFACKNAMANAESDIEYFEAVIEVLTEQAAAEVVTETVAVLTAIVTVANKAKAVRRAVATLANKLRKLNYSLSDAFKRAWTLTKSFKGLLPSLS